MPSPRRRMHRLRNWMIGGVLLLSAAALTAAALGAPYFYAELLRWLPQPTLVDSAAPKLARGRMVDDYFVVEDLGDQVFAIGEPRYWQQNYSYLIVGAQRAVLFDAGSGTRDLSTVVRGLTALPVTVLVSHLHYDHLGGIGRFAQMAALDVPDVRRAVRDDVLMPSRYQFAGFIEGRAAPSVRISEWWVPGTEIDLGGRRLEVLWTPGHTPNSAALYDRAHHALFIGDFLYPGPLYVFLPGASRSAYRATTEHLLRMLPADVRLWAAHCCRPDVGVAAPQLGTTDLKDLDTALTSIEDGSAHAKGFYPRVYPVNALMTFETGFPWNNR